ncbi:BUD13 homolog isoform X1 [Balaenoptera musculus]|uniref:BUD13 homolog n=2 Tax=Balaenoptera musculus TaxID=9771 RepID=A0A8B8Y5T9_BALMU|nr:BUD13 homolog isoform X1 [Balaenoptera musculus]
MAAAPPLSKAEYLKRYLSGADAGVDGGPESGRKRRKKRPKTGGAGGKGMRIVDDDVSWTSMSTTKTEKEEEEDDGDLPVVAEFVDERPEEVKQMEAFRSSAKWKLLGGHNEDLPSHRHFRHDTPDSSPPRRVHHDTLDSFPPRRVRHDTLDSSPPRRVCYDTPDSSSPRRVRHDPLDSSPPRTVCHDTPDSLHPRRVRHDTPDSSPPRRVCHDSPDPSPPRRAYHDSDPSPPRRARHDSPDPSSIRKPHRHSSGVSPRRARHDTPDPSPPRRAHHNSSDISPRRRAHNSSPDTAQPRRTLDSVDTPQLRRAHHNSPDLASNVPHSLPRTKSSKAPESSSKTSPHRKGPGPSHLSLPKNSKYEYDAELSPPRKKQAKSRFGSKQHDSKGSSPSHRKYHKSSSPRRHQSHMLDSSSYPSDSRKASDSDLSPPRHKQSSGPRDSDSDLSPPRNRPRHGNSDSDLSPPRRKQRAKSSDSDLSPPRRSQPLGKKAAHMYSGAKTGLVLTDIQREQQELKRRDQETMAFEAEFQYAETVFRDKFGRKRNLKLERLEQRRKAEKDSERDELYAQWGKGLAQRRQQQQNVEDAMKEMQKPLARYIDDEDLDRMLREKEREGDPMANLIKKNKAKESKNKKVRPRYSGPAPPPNRFNIWPGYRWDGVDRSNGFEQKRFARLTSKKAVEELAYKWSVEDM